MLDFGLYVEETPDAITGTRPTVSGDEASERLSSVIGPQPPVLITEHEVMFGTAVALARPPTSVIRRMIGSLRAAAALRPPPPRPHYAHRASYLENACMSREMDRL